MKAQIEVITRPQFEDLIHEALGLTGSDEATMNECLALSGEIWAGRIDDKVYCVFGLVPPSLLSDQAYIWFYCKPEMDQHKFILVRRSQMVIEDILKVYNSLYGHVHVDNDRAKAWIRWLGGEIGEPIGDAQPFTIRKRKWIQ